MRFVQLIPLNTHPKSPLDTETYESAINAGGNPECRSNLDIESEVSIEVTGFDLAEIDAIVTEPMDEKAESGSLPEPIEPGPAISGPGDKWYLGEYSLLCGSSLERANLERVLDGRLARMVLTDAPYNVKIVGNVSGLGKKTHSEFLQASSEMSDEEFARFLTDSIGLHAEFCSDGALLYEFMDWRHGDEMYAAIAANGLTMINLAVWVKSAGSIGSLYRSQHELVFIVKKGQAPHRNNVKLAKYGRYRTNSWQYPGMNSFGKDRDELLAMHPTVKNLTMFADAIRDVTDRGDIVFEGFAGSGTTIIAAKMVRHRAARRAICSIQSVFRKAILMNSVSRRGIASSKPNTSKIPAPQTAAIRLELVWSVPRGAQAQVFFIRGPKLGSGHFRRVHRGLVCWNDLGL